MAAIVSLDAEREARQQGPEGFEDLPLIMSPKTLGECLEVSPTTLARWRREGNGPAFFEPPGANMIRYARADVIAWLTASKKPVAATTGQNNS